MSDTDDSTLRSAQEALKCFLAEEKLAEDLPTEADLREQAHALALGVAYAWATRDPQAQEAFLHELVAMPNDLGVMFAVEVFTEIRLFALRPGTLRQGTEVTTQWAPARHPGQQPVANTGQPPAFAADSEWDGRQRECVEIITDLWSGLGSWHYERVTLARARLARLPTSQVRETLRIMAYDAYVAMERFAAWQGVGAEAVEDYRLKYPADYEVGSAP
jgi:hypothetical protein